MTAAEKSDDDSTGQTRVGGQRIDANDARELRWYFGDPTIAGVGAGGSMGAMLERAAIMATHLVACQRCGGDRDTDTPGTGYCARGGGGYKKALNAYRKDFAKQKGLRLVDTKEDAAEWRRLGVNNVASADEVAEWLPDNLTKRCVRCEGTGMVQKRRSNSAGAQTVRSTGSSVHGDPNAMHCIDEQALARYGAITRLLDAVRNKSLRARAALAIYFSPTGGSIGSLWLLTEEGGRFYERTDNPRHLAPEALMQNEREDNREHPRAERTIAFGRIASQCSAVWDEACAVWAEVSQ